MGFPNLTHRLACPYSASVSKDKGGGGGATENTWYYYDKARQLEYIKYDTPSSGRDLKFSYDGLGRRIAVERGTATVTNGQVTSFSVSETRKFAYLGGSVIQELNSSNQVVKEYLRGLGLGGGIRGIIYQRKGSDYYYYHYNHKGDVVALTDGSGELAAYYEYDAWGNTMTEAETSGVDNPYRYSTKEWDEKSGLYYFGARYYYPEIGRWIQRDPAGLVDGLNLYGYVQNSPATLMDPWGLYVTFEHIEKAKCLLMGMGLARKDLFRNIVIGPADPMVTGGGAALTIPDWLSPHSWIFINRNGSEDPIDLAQTILHELGHVVAGPMWNKKDHAAWEKAASEGFEKRADEMRQKLTNETICHPGTGKKYYLSEFGALLKRCNIAEPVDWIVNGGKPAE